ncbi:MAG: branched-chain amino acid aminotransferase [Vicingaceae bacterium]|jgi:branched-chain amino acid aminotransferase
MKFGDGVFESIRVVAGKVKYLDFHLERMQKGLKALEINCSKGEIEILKVCIEQLLIKNEIERGAILRIIAQRSGLGKYAPESNQVFFYIETDRVSTDNYALNQDGYKLGISQNVTIYPTQFSGLKTLNSLQYVMAAKEKEESDYNELILLDANGFLVEGTSSNLFVSKGNVVCTPDLKHGAIGGVMRRVVINKLSQLGYQVKQTSLGLADLEQAEEIFFCNSIQGVTWVSSYSKKRYFKKISTKLVELL